MTVFKTFWKVVNHYKMTILLYTILLIFFGGLNMKSKDTTLNFVDSKPDVYIVNEDEEVGITKNLMDYFRQNTNVVEIEESIEDALFYRQVNYVIYIPKNYRTDFLNHQNPSLSFKSTGDYQASFANMLLERFVKVQDALGSSYMKEEELIDHLNKIVGDKTEVLVTSKLNADELSGVTQYFNFASYTLMATVIFIICLVLSSFHESRVQGRILISKMSNQSHNRLILWSSFVYTLIVFLLFSLMGFLLFGTTLLTLRGFFYLLNAFLFLLVALALAILIANLVNHKEAVSGIVNVIALGSAFLCGAFVPVEWLPVSVLKIAHVLPSFWYIKSNEFLKTAESLQWEHLGPLWQNMIFLILFGLFFLILNQVISRMKQKRN
jgi:ABC-2 type transport system permease protein